MSSFDFEDLLQVEPEEKTCKGCDSIYIPIHYKQVYCSPKCRENIRKNSDNRKNQKRKYSKIHYYKNREKCIKSNKNTKLKRNFGITLEQYIQLKTNQNHKCAICNRKKFSKRDLSVDHDHSTGQIRGLICYKCNLMLGNAEEQIETLQNAIVYLSKWNKKQ